MHNTLNPQLNIWTAAIPQQIVASLLSSQPWQQERTETLDSDTVATLLSDPYCEYAFIRNTHIDEGQNEKSVYYQCYEKTAEDLEKVGFSFQDVIRTWIYLDHINTYYPPFNAQRDQFYREQAVFERLVPASTAIGITSPNGQKMFCHVLALRKKTDEVTVKAVPSPLQCSAMDYQVSFSRALEVQTPGYHRLFISGTASINAEGKTVHIGEIEKQAQQTAKVVDALLESRQMTQEHITRLLAYTKRDADFGCTNSFIHQWLTGRQGILNVNADVCRDELLFEVEAEAFLSVEH